MPRFIKLGDIVEIKKGWNKGDWGKVVDINDDDNEYFVAMFGGENDCHVFARSEIKLASEDFRKQLGESKEHYVGTFVEGDSEYGDVYECSFDELFGESYSRLTPRQKELIETYWDLQDASENHETDEYEEAYLDGMYDIIHNFGLELLFNDTGK